MARIIEFSGAPGVGKSTTYHQISKALKKEDGWIPAHLIYPRKKRSANPLKKLRNLLSATTEQTDIREMRKAAARFAAQHPVFIDACWAHIMNRERVSVNQTDQRFEKADHVFKLTQKIQICREYQSNKLVLMEEGILNGIGNALHRYTNDTELTEEIRDLLPFLPLPDGLVYFHADSSTIEKRFLERNRYIPFMQNLNGNALVQAIEQIVHIRKTAAKLYEDCGYPVLYVDAARSVNDNVCTIKTFLHQVKQKGIIA